MEKKNRNSELEVLTSELEVEAQVGKAKESLDVVNSLGSLLYTLTITLHSFLIDTNVVALVPVFGSYILTVFQVSPLHCSQWEEMLFKF